MKVVDIADVDWRTLPFRLGQEQLASLSSQEIGLARLCYRAALPGLIAMKEIKFAQQPLELKASIVVIWRL